MIIGIGVDLVDSRRISRIIERFGNSFLERIFTKSECLKCTQKKDLSLAFSKIFAVKEAAIKAISVTKGIKWHDFETDHDKNGKPILNIVGNARSNLDSLSHNQLTKVHVSLSDEPPYVIAYVVIDI